ncbi:MAG: GH3 auxin-responsive promoter family protein [Cytophagales bacterium]|nr:GH3 auxin-responsive promoter family protein [Cytophagales bacterium]
MSFMSFASKIVASYVIRKREKWVRQPVATQKKTLDCLLKKGAATRFGEDHNFSEIRNYEDFKKQVPLVDYEGLRPYIERILQGERDVLWKGKPLYFAKTSGTTSGVKYIPITKDSIHNHIDSARNMLLGYIHETGKADFLKGKLIFLSGSPVMDKKAGIFTGRLSGIVNHHVPQYLRRNQMPSYTTNCIEDWEEKVDRIVEETHDKNMTLISGIPPWVQMYFDRLMDKGGKKIKDLFPNFSLFIWGGVNFEPYRAKLRESIGKEIDTLETYPASEGFIAYQDTQTEEGLLLLLNEGIFYEFIPAEEYHDENPTRISLEKVELGRNYAIILNSNAGLWGYSIGDTVRFVSKNPYRIVVTGRIKHFISAFGEHVIGEEVERAMQFAQKNCPETELTEFTVAPNVTPKDGLPLHEWYVEFRTPPDDQKKFERLLNEEMCRQNVYYQDLIEGNILRALKTFSLREAGFRDYMKSIGKLGGQNKVPRLSNDRKIADALQSFLLEREEK